MTRPLLPWRGLTLARQLDVSKPVRAPGSGILWPGRSVVHCATIDQRRPAQRKTGDRLAPGRRIGRMSVGQGTGRPAAEKKRLEQAAILAIRFDSHAVVVAACPEAPEDSR